MATSAAVVASLDIQRYSAEVLGLGRHSYSETAHIHIVAPSAALETNTDAELVVEAVESQVSVLQRTSILSSRGLDALQKTVARRLRLGRSGLSDDPFGFVILRRE